jgi:hypothetical protein
MPGIPDVLAWNPDILCAVQQVRNTGRVVEVTASYLRTYRTSCRCRSAPVWKWRTRCTSQFRSGSPRRAGFGPSCTSRFSVGENRCSGSAVFSAVAVSPWPRRAVGPGEVDHVKLPQARTSASPAALRRTKTDVVGAKACQRARHIRCYRTASRLGDRGRNDGRGPGVRRQSCAPRQRRCAAASIGPKTALSRIGRASSHDRKPAIGFCGCLLLLDLRSGQFAVAAAVFMIVRPRPTNGAVTAAPGRGALARRRRAESSDFRLERLAAPRDVGPAR